MSEPLQLYYLFILKENDKKKYLLQQKHYREKVFYQSMLSKHEPYNDWIVVHYTLLCFTDGDILHIAQLVSCIGHQYNLFWQSSCGKWCIVLSPEEHLLEYAQGAVFDFYFLLKTQYSSECFPSDSCTHLCVSGLQQIWMLQL